MKTHRILLFATGCLGITVAAACTGGDKVDPRCALSDSHYQGGATDEVCMVLVDEEDRGNIQIGGPNAAVMVMPSSGAVVSSTATAITFSWTSLIDVDGDAGFLPPHEPPVTGAVHMIRVKGVGHDGGDDLYFTTRLHYDFTGHAVEHMIEAADPISVEITSVYVTENRILTPATDGPFRPTSDTTFSFAP